MTAAPAPLAPLAVSVVEAAKLIGVSRTHIANEIRKGSLTARKSGTRSLILIEDLKAYLANLPVIPATDQDQTRNHSWSPT